MSMWRDKKAQPTEPRDVQHTALPPPLPPPSLPDRKRL